MAEREKLENAIVSSYPLTYTLPRQITRSIAVCSLVSQSPV